MTTKKEKKIFFEHTKLFINGEYEESSRTFQTINPYEGKVLAMIHQAQSEHVEKAIQASRKSFETWSHFPSSGKALYLNKLADEIELNCETIAKMDTLENGIALSEMRLCVKGAAEILRFYAGMSNKIKGLTIPANEQNLISLTVREPIGVIAIIIPWNSPTLMLAKTIGPALICGNTVIVKPAQQTSLSALFIGSLTKKIDFPPGVINVIPGGPEIGRYLAESNGIDAITFTGSCEVGKKIIHSSARSNLKRVTLELGGKSPLVIFSDVHNLKQSAKVAFKSLFIGNGQVCCSATRIYVQDKIYEEFINEIANLARAQVLGNPLLESTDQGPLVDEVAVERVMNFIKKGIEEGARLVVGGARVGTTLFIEPTVFADVKEEMLIGKEEIFGPVMQIFKFSTLEEVIERSNQTRFGLASGIFTSDISKAMTFARQVKAGICWINCYFIVRAQTPFGGYRQSGWGREFGEAALEEYLENKCITINCSNDCLFG